MPHLAIFVNVNVNKDSETHTRASEYVRMVRKQHFAFWGSRAFATGLSVSRFLRLPHFAIFVNINFNNYFETHTRASEYARLVRRQHFTLRGNRAFAAGASAASHDFR